MRLLYLSNLQDEGFAGLTYSVPAQIAAQSCYDEVHWYNFQPVERASWRKHAFYHNPNDYSFDVDGFCRRFWIPDLIIFEGFYAFHPSPLLLKLISMPIPYVIVPRCALTKGDQGKKKIKKTVCNMVFYIRFARGAAAIHYLTKKEMLESGSKWNTNYFIEPNGIEPIEKPTPALSKPNNPIRIVYIGRLEPYQKGLDILLEAFDLLKSTNRLRGFSLSIHGNSVNGYAETIKAFIDNKQLSDVVSIHPPVYDDEKRRVLERSDVFLLTSRYEGMPMGLLEACAHGLPCIVTPGTNLADEIQIASSGWVCELTPASIADAIYSAASIGPEQYLRMSNRSKGLAGKYTWSSIAEASHRDYSNLVMSR